MRKKERENPSVVVDTTLAVGQKTITPGVSDTHTGPCSPHFLFVQRDLTGEQERECVAEIESERDRVGKRERENP